MDSNTKFLLERMDKAEERLSLKLQESHDTLSKKIDVLWAFRLKILGASMVVSGIASALITALVEHTRK